MRSLSNVIKGNFVLYDRDPMLINIESSGETDIDNVEKTASKNALESVGTSLKSAIAEANEIINRGRVDSELAFLNAVRDAERQGHEDGLKKGRGEGGARAAENVRTNAHKFIAHALELDRGYLKELSEVKADCVDFAFGLAEDILGIPVDRDGEDYNKLINGFLCRKTCKVAIEVGGYTYPFETLQTGGLVSCAGGLQGILVCAEDPREDEASNTIGVMETQKQATINEQATASGQNSVSGRSETENTKPYAENEAAENEEFISVSNRQSKNLPDEPAQGSPDEQTGENSAFRKHDEHDEQDNDDEAESAEKTENEQKVKNEKFVFVRPTRKPLKISAIAGGDGRQKIDFNDLSQLDQDSLKAISRKAEIKDIAAALSGAGDNVTSVLMGSLTRRIKEKVLDAMKYLGPVPQTEIDDARDRITALAADTLKARERDESDV
jgi:hypothetical protein